LQVLDALHIYEGGGEEGDEGVSGEGGDEGASEEGGDKGASEEGGGERASEEGRERAGEASKLQIVWSRDWLKCALVIDGRCHAVFDFEAHGGYNISEFPPPNEIWTRGDRKLTGEVINRLF
ncbi:MAG TPA: DUF2251 domain-containing protein, partial [Puia sp.]|nr:DUF2251 domain-containing protein [Puia sp.]